MLKVAALYVLPHYADVTVGLRYDGMCTRSSGLTLTVRQRTRSV